MARRVNEPLAFVIMHDIFPPFERQTEDPSYLNLFKVAQVINPQPRGHLKAVVSTSLYWGTHGPHVYKPTLPTLAGLQTPAKSVRQGKSWWESYFLPFLKGCQEPLPDGWRHRVYLAADLTFLIDLIPTTVEIHVMAESSWTSMPGMMWRYLPAEESLLCIARGADNYEMGGHQQVIALALCLGTFLVRNTITFWRDKLNRLVYRSVQGSCAIRGPIPFVPTAAAWIEANQKKLFPSQVEAFPELTHIGLNHWGAYGQDEQFLSRWLYYLAASEKTITLVEPEGNHEIFQEDMSFWQAHGKLHSVIRR